MVRDSRFLHPLGVLKLSAALNAHGDFIVWILYNDNPVCKTNQLLYSPNVYIDFVVWITNGDNTA